MSAGVLTTSGIGAERFRNVFQPFTEKEEAACKYHGRKTSSCKRYVVEFVTFADVYGPVSSGSPVSKRDMRESQNATSLHQAISAKIDIIGHKNWQLRRSSRATTSCSQ